MGGMVLETNMTEILTRIEEQTRIEKQEVGVKCDGPLARLLLAVGSSGRSSLLFFVCLLLLAAQVHYILGELCFGGLALETNMAEILSHLDEQNKLEKQEVIDWPTKPKSLPLVHCSAFVSLFVNIFLVFGMECCHVGDIMQLCAVCFVLHNLFVLLFPK